MTNNNLRKDGGIVYLVMVFSFLIMSPLAYGDENRSSINNLKNKIIQNTLKISPQRCVALREGQICYQNIVLKWQTLARGNFCLFRANSKQPLKCWDKRQQGVHEFDFQSSESVEFILKNKTTDRELARVKMIVAWVYGNKKRRRASWRLF